MFHSQDDSTVPFEDGKPFNDVSILITGEDLPVVYGSSAISKRCDTLGLENQFHSYEGEEARGHDVHENGTVALHMDIIPSISNWFYEKYLRPQNLSITGIENICSEDVNQTYEIPSEGFVYYDWEITGGQLINVDPLSNSIAVIWDNAIGSKELSVRPYLCNAVPGEKVSIPVELHVPSSNEWLGGNGMWSTVSNWGNGHIPLSCEDVILPAESSLVEVVVAPLSVGKIRSLRIGYNVKLLVPASANITIE